MKTIFTIFLCLLSFTVLFGQEQPAAMIHEDGLHLSATDSTIYFYTYTPEGHVASVTAQKLDDAGNWVNLTKTVNTYNVLELLTESIEANWNTGQQAWLDSRRNTRTYTAGGKLATNLYEDWGNNEWVNDSREISYFSSEELPDSSIAMMWNNADEWQFTNRSYYIWNAEGLLAEGIYSVFTNNAWRFNSKTTNTYTDFGALSETTRFIYYGPQWVPFGREIYTYNTEDQLTEIKVGDYNTDNQSWTYNFRVTSTYNADGTLHQEIFAAYDDALGAFIPAARNTYFYGDYVLGLEEEAFAFAVVFPNPAQADVQIRFQQAVAAELVLTDLQGKKLSETSVSGLTATVSLEGLPAGTYLLNLTNGNHSETKRILKY